MEIEGTIHQIMSLVEGQGQSGKAWKKQEFVIQHGSGQYPKFALFNVWGDKTSVLSGLRVGDTVAVTFQPESREYNGRWYTDLKADSVRVLNVTNVSAPAAAAPGLSADESAVATAMKGKNSPNATKEEKNAAWVYLKGEIAQKGAKHVIAAVNAMPGGYTHASQVKAFVGTFAAPADAPEPGADEDLPF